VQPTTPAPPLLRPDSKPPDPLAWLTTQETAAALGLTPKTLANMRTQGKGPCFHKIGGKVWYLGQDILTYQRRRRYIASGVRDES
jgi:Helix-turn-helix domain